MKRRPLLEPVTLSGAGVGIAAGRGGPEQGPLVILAHGAGQTRHSWGAAADRLAAGGFHVIALDLRGHGASDWSPDGDYGLDRFVDDIAAIVGALGRSAFLVGASLGGLASLLAAGERRVPAAGLVLVDVAPRIEIAGASAVGAFMRANPDGFANLAEAGEAVAAYMPARPRPSDPNGLLKNLRLGADGRYRWHWDPRFMDREISAAALAENQIRLEQAARGLAMPAMLVRGALSAVLSRQGAEDFQRLVPSAEIVDIAGADHMVAGDRNDQFNNAVAGFLCRHAREPHLAALNQVTGG